MKTKTFFTFIICSILLLANMPAVSAQKAKKEKKTDKETIELYVPDMHCKNCQKKIENNISYEKGITDLKVDLKNKTVAVTFKKKQTDKEKIQAAFNKIGYSTEIIEKKQK